MWPNVTFSVIGLCYQPRYRSCMQVRVQRLAAHFAPLDGFLGFQRAPSRARLHTRRGSNEPRRVIFYSYEMGEACLFPIQLRIDNVGDAHFGW